MLGVWLCGTKDVVAALSAMRVEVANRGFNNARLSFRSTLVVVFWYSGVWCLSATEPRVFDACSEVCSFVSVVTSVELWVTYTTLGFVSLEGSTVIVTGVVEDPSLAMTVTVGAAVCCADVCTTVTTEGLCEGATTIGVVDEATVVTVASSAVVSALTAVECAAALKLSVASLAAAPATPATSPTASTAIVFAICIGISNICPKLKATIVGDWCQRLAMSCWCSFVRTQSLVSWRK